MNAAEMFRRCSARQALRDTISEPEHGCGTRGGNELADSPILAVVREEGVIEGCHELGSLATDHIPTIP